MIKKFFVIVAVFFLALGNTLKADEGMWLLSLIHKNYEDMKKQGFKLTPEDIYNINKSSLKDAVCGLSNERAPLGFFCTAEVISDQGLLLTNHHCGYESIQSHSTVEHDYLSDGFWAMSKDQELSNDGMCASFLISMEDVTEKVLANVTSEMSEADRSAAIKKAIKEIEKEAKKDNDYNVSVKNMFEGNQYFLFVYETYKDIRLVGAPPSAIGKFGGDTDNWMWPRHTGDFSMLRVYMSPEGKSVKYAKENVPYKPKHHFPISLKGVEKNDFSMVMGFPGSTERYLTSYGVKEALDITNPAAVKIRTKKLELMKTDMDLSDEIRIKYAAKYAQTANYWKYYIGQSKGLKRLDVYGQKVALEKKFSDWAAADENRKKEYGDALSLISNSYEKGKEEALAQQYLFEAIFQGGEIIMFPFQSMSLANVLKNSPDNAENIKALADQAKEAGDAYFKDYNAPTDQKIFAALMEMFYKDVPESYHLPVFKTIASKYKGDFNRYAADVFKKSIFTDQTRYNAFLAKPSFKVLEKDPAYQLSQEVLQLYFSLQGDESADRDKGLRLFVKGLMEMQPDKNFYPDANSTIRLTYGTVGDYRPADAVYYNYFTTIDGIIEKEDPSVDEFIVPAKLKELYKKKDYGRYADKDGNLHVCFTTNNDITGGNSGSPVINGNGELIGTAFDGNWEAMSGDIAFENQLQKCINVDVRYTLFIIDKYAGAKNLINEMTIVE